MGTRPSVADHIKLQDRRQRLQTRVETFEKQASKYLGIDVDINSGVDFEDGSRWDSIVTEDGPEPATGDELDDEFELPPEKAILTLPSQIGLTVCLESNLDELVKQEILLREGQANDALHHIRYALGFKSFLYRTRVRTANSQRTKLRSFDEVNSVQKIVQQHGRIYTRARQAIITLTTEDEEDRSPDEIARLAKYQALQHEDLKAITAINEPLVRGQRNAMLAWIWNMDVQADIEESPWMKECEYSVCHSLILVDHRQVYRVNWLRAKARRERWKEEKILVKSEMKWTIAYFQYRAVKWEELVEDAGYGAACYARRQASMWRGLVVDAREKFDVIINN